MARGSGAEIRFLASRVIIVETLGGDHPLCQETGGVVFRLSPTHTNKIKIKKNKKKFKKYLRI